MGMFEAVFAALFVIGAVALRMVILRMSREPHHELVGDKEVERIGFTEGIRTRAPLRSAVIEPMGKDGVVLDADAWVARTHLSRAPLGELRAHKKGRLPDTATAGAGALADDADVDAALSFSKLDDAARAFLRSDARAPALALSAEAGFCELRIDTEGKVIVRFDRRPDDDSRRTKALLLRTVAFADAVDPRPAGASGPASGNPFPVR